MNGWNVWRQTWHDRFRVYHHTYGVMVNGFIVPGWGTITIIFLFLVYVSLSFISVLCSLEKESPSKFLQSFINTSFQTLMIFLDFMCILIFGEQRLDNIKDNWHIYQLIYKCLVEHIERNAFFWDIPRLTYSGFIIFHLRVLYSLSDVVPTIWWRVSGLDRARSGQKHIMYSLLTNRYKFKKIQFSCHKVPPTFNVL